MNLKIILPVMATGVFLSIMGCASYTPPTGESTATIQGSTLNNGWKTVILEINGDPLISSAKKYTGMCYEAMPDDVHIVGTGDCNLMVKAYNGPSSYGLVTGWSTKGTVSFVAEQGKKYSVMAKVDDNLITPDQAEFYVVENR